MDNMIELTICLFPAMRRSVRKKDICVLLFQYVTEITVCSALVFFNSIFFHFIVTCQQYFSTTLLAIMFVTEICKKRFAHFKGVCLLDQRFCIIMGGNITNVISPQYRSLVETVYH